MGATLISGQAGTEAAALRALRETLQLDAVGHASYLLARTSGSSAVYFDFVVRDGRLYLDARDAFYTDVNGWTGDYYFFGTAARGNADQLLRFALEWTRVVLKRGPSATRLRGLRSWGELRRDVHAALPVGVTAGPDLLAVVIDGPVGSGRGTGPSTAGDTGVVVA